MAELGHHKSRSRAQVVGLMIAVVVVTSCGGAFNTLGVVGTSDFFIIDDGTVISEDVYVAAGSARIDGRIKGDLYVVADRLDIGGRVDGNVLAASSVARIDGVVSGSVRVLGVDQVVSGLVGRDLAMVGREAIVTGTVGDDVAVVSRNLQFAGEAGGDLGGRVFGHTVVSGRIGDDIEDMGTKMVIWRTARVGGALRHPTDNPPMVEEGAVTGPVVGVRPYDPARLVVGGLRLMLQVVGALLFWSYGLWSTHRWRRTNHREVGYLAVRPLRCLVWGAVRVSLILVPVMIVALGVLWGNPAVASKLLVVGLVGTPAAAVLLLRMLFRAPIAALVLAGGWAWSRSARMPSQAGAFITAAVPAVIAALSLPLYIGWVMAGLVVCFGEGARVVTLRRAEGAT